MSENLDSQDINIEKKQLPKKHFEEKWFDGFWTYEVQWEITETLYSIVIELIQRNIPNSDKTLLRNLFINKVTSGSWFKSIEKWDLIMFNVSIDKGYLLTVWPNSYELNSDKFITTTKEFQEAEEKIREEDRVELLIDWFKEEKDSSFIINKGWIVYTKTIVVWNDIKWQLPKELDLDAKRIKLGLRDALLWKEIKDFTVNDLVSWEYLSEYSTVENEEEILNNFKWFVTAVKTWGEFKSLIEY